MRYKSEMAGRLDTMSIINGGFDPSLKCASCQATPMSCDTMNSLSVDNIIYEHFREGIEHSREGINACNSRNA